MKKINVQICYVYNNKTYILNPNRKEKQIGDIMYDGRVGEFVLLETEEDLNKYSFLAPECYGLLDKI